MCEAVAHAPAHPKGTAGDTPCSAGSHGVTVSSVCPALMCKSMNDSRAASARKTAKNCFVVMGSTPSSLPAVVPNTTHRTRPSDESTRQYLRPQLPPQGASDVHKLPLREGLLQILRWHGSSQVLGLLVLVTVAGACRGVATATADTPTCTCTTATGVVGATSGVLPVTATPTTAGASTAVDVVAVVAATTTGSTLPTS